MANVDYEQKCKEELESIQNIEFNINKLKSEIGRLKLEKKSIAKEMIRQPMMVSVQEEQVQDDSFEDEINYYLRSYRQLDEYFKDADIKSILPRKKHPRYKDILLRLSLESVKEIKEVNEILRNEDISADEKILCEGIIETEKRKIDFIKSRLIKSDKEEKDEQEEKNKIILAPTATGNIRLIDELEHIPNDYYAGFKELIDSIIDGTFKNVKAFASNSELSGLTEVKGFKIRVAFARIDTNTYALISAFIKKSDNDKLYRETLIRKAREYYRLEDSIKQNLSNPEFLEENEKSIQQLFNILSPKETKAERKEI